MGKRADIIRDRWNRIRTSRGFHNILLYLEFVGIAVLFWIVMAMNDNVTKNLNVKLKITNVPDTVTFITVPPESFHVTVRDKGTNLMRNGVMKHPEINVNFRDYASDGILHLTYTDIQTGIKSLFGNTVQISSCSLDSLRLRYTTNPGKRVPVIVSVDIAAASGYIISGPPIPETRGVSVYSDRDVLDTVMRAYTSRIVKRNLSQTTVVNVPMVPINGARIIPSSIKVTIPVEPLVNKETVVSVEADGVPSGEKLLLFPPTVTVSYFVPMSMFNDDDEIPIKVKVNYTDIFKTGGDVIPLQLGQYPDYIVNPELKSDSVEYAIVKL